MAGDPEFREFSPGGFPGFSAKSIDPEITNMTVNPTDCPEAPRLGGFDTLRIAALALVTWQHAASTFGGYETTQWRGISPGQAGVGIFCVLSGYLAFHVAQRSPGQWLWRRLAGIFPSYWIVTALAFGLALVFGGGGKEISLGLFVSQMAGLGFFTHGWQLVNVVSWFVSLILLCYLLSFVAMIFGNPRVFWVVVAAVAVLLLATRSEVGLSRHVLGFACGALFGCSRSLVRALLLGAALVVLGVFGDPQFFYAGCGLMLVGATVGVAPSEALPMRWLASYSYEYFLLHGILLAAAARVIAVPWLSVSVAVGASIAAAVALNKVEARVRAFGVAIKPGQNGR